MFSGTLRFNLDPFDEASDERITDLIKKANLEYILEGKSKQELEQEQKAKDKENPVAKATKVADDDKGLNFKVKEEGKNLSVGER